MEANKITAGLATVKLVREKLAGVANTVSKKGDVFTVRRSFFYTHGKTSEDFAGKVSAALRDAVVTGHGEVWKAFSGRATVAKQSHWWCTFKFPA